MTKLTNQTLTAVLCFACALVLAPRLVAAAPGVRIASPETLQLLDPAGQPLTTWTVESTIQDVLQIDTTLYVACGPRGVLIYDLAAPEKPALIGRIAEGRNVVKLAQNGKALLVVVADFSALTFSLGDPQKPKPSPLNPPSGGSRTLRSGDFGLLSPELHSTTESGSPPRAPRSSWARVTSVRGGWVAVNTNRPVQVGDRFIIHSQRRVRVGDRTLTQKLYGPSDLPTGMFLVSRVSGDRASGLLPRGTIAYVDDLAEPTAEPMYAPKVGPQLWYGMGRFYGNLRPIIGVSSTNSFRYDTAPFAMINDFALEYYFRVPIKLGVQLGPQTLLVGRNASLGTELRALLSFASSYFELGLEPGVELHLNGRPQLLLGYLIRIGSLDGLNLILRNSYTVDTQATRNSLGFGSISMEINIPVANRFNLYFTGSGAEEWGYGTVGLKYFARGGGGPGSLIVSSGIGGAWLSDLCKSNPNGTNATVCQTAPSMEAFGPMLSVGLDARF